MNTTFKDKISHRRLHTGEKIFECDICKKKCTLKSDLVKHKRIHTGEKPYKCNICEKTFTHSSTLANHKSVHTGDKLYSCDVCQKSYSQSSGLSAHNKTVAHIERMKSKNKNNLLIPSSFVDCGESIKEKDIKEEIKDDESVDDPLSYYSSAD
jgi:uncharacterized Zn-finger protein